MKLYQLAVWPCLKVFGEDRKDPKKFGSVPELIEVLFASF